MEAFPIKMSLELFLPIPNASGKNSDSTTEEDM